MDNSVVWLVGIPHLVLKGWRNQKIVCGVADVQMEAIPMTMIYCEEESTCPYCSLPLFAQKNEQYPLFLSREEKLLAIF